MTPGEIESGLVHARHELIILYTKSRNEQYPALQRGERIRFSSLSDLQQITAPMDAVVTADQENARGDIIDDEHRSWTHVFMPRREEGILVHVSQLSIGFLHHTEGKNPDRAFSMSYARRDALQIEGAESSRLLMIASPNATDSPEEETVGLEALFWRRDGKENGYTVVFLGDRKMDDGEILIEEATVRFREDGVMDGETEFNYHGRDFGRRLFALPNIVNG